MSRYRNVALAVGVWLLVVTGGAVLAWTVISQAGHDVAGAPPVVNASASPSSGRPSPRPSSTPADTGGAVRGTWRGAAGLVVGECTGPSYRLVSAVPASGWQVDVDDSGDDPGRVEFETTDERSRVRVQGGCEGGAPIFSVDTRTKG